jgi:uncharacterized protein (TIGR03086 family)
VLRHVIAASEWLTRLLLLWTLTIVVLPFPTALVAGHDAGDQAATKLLYVGTMAASSLVLSLICLEIRRNAALRDSDDRPDVVRGFATFGAFVVLLVLMLAVPVRGLDQATTLLGSVSDSDLSTPTPCHEWTVAELVDHLVAAPTKFAAMVRGDEVDWSAPTPHVDGERAERFRASADELVSAWNTVGEGDAPMGPDWQSAEVAVHTYDLAAALGRPTSEHDAEVAERGLALMQANLTPENRGQVFLPEQPAPEGADAYQRIAAFAGRTVPTAPSGSSA